MGYGFRVFEVQLRKGAFGRTPIDWGGWDGSEPFVSTVHELLDDLKDRSQTLSGIPNLGRPGEDSTEAREGDPQIRVIDAVRDGDRLSATVRYGLRGEFDAAFGDDATDQVDLHSRTASSLFRMELLAPQQGLIALLAVEAIGTRCPVTMVTRWLGRAGYEADPDNWLRLSSLQVADHEHIKSLIKDSERVSIKLSKRGTSIDGGRRSAPTVLTAELVTTQRKMDALKEAMDWAVNGVDQDHSPVHRVEEIAGLEAGQLEEAGLRFEDAAIVVKDEETGKTRTIKPERIRAMFTYPISHEIRPVDQAWRASVDEKFRAVSGDLDIVLD